MLCANGHFLGQDYILKPLSKQLRLNLDRLDPDGTGAGGDLWRSDVFMAMVPTTFGVWLDWWNVHMFLIKERADVYSEQLQDPQHCVTCGLVHTPYEYMMRASGKQVSLCWQIVPLGIVIGKAGEYFNDPPVFYRGKCLPCLKMAGKPAEARPQVPGKRRLLRFLVFLADCCAFALDRV